MMVARSEIDTEKMREALEFYAKKENWDVQFKNGFTLVPVKVDRGHLARIALGLPL